MNNTVARLRRYYNISQKDMAELVGISYNAYGLKERGKSQFKHGEMVAIVNALNAQGDKVYTLSDVFDTEKA